MDDYPDRNSNGIPDAFENRRPISEILNEPEVDYDHEIRWVAPLVGPVVPTLVNDHLQGFMSSDQLAKDYDKVRAELLRAENHVIQLTKQLNAFRQQNRQLVAEVARLLRESTECSISRYIPRDGSTEQCAVCETHCMVQDGGLEVHGYPSYDNRTGPCPGSGTINIKRD